MPAWTPPPGFEKADSLIPGIEVYTPSAPSLRDTPRQFSCESCGSQRGLDAGVVALVASVWIIKDALKSENA